jgi:hypothetical protein
VSADQTPTSPASDPAVVRDQWHWTSRGFGPSGTGLSRLAVLESLIATGAMLWATYYFHLYWPLAIALVTVPFTLLRTEQSDERTTRFALKLIRRCATYSSVEELEKPIDFFSYHSIKRSLQLFWFTGVVLVVAVLARLGSLAVSLTTDFWRSIEVVPSNWKKICLSVDLLRPIEILPGKGGYPNETMAFEIERFQQRQSSFLSNGGIVGSMLAFFIAFRLISPEQFGVNWYWLKVAFLFATTFTLLLLVYMVPYYVAYFAALWYRWSLKSTSVLWLPLLFIASDVAAPGWSAQRRMKRIHESGFASNLRWFGLVSSLLVLSYLALRISKAKLAAYIHEHVPLIDYFFGGPAGVVVGAWTLASLLNTVLDWMLYWFVDWELERREHGKSLRDAIAIRILKVVALIRWGLFGFSWVCSGYVFYIIIRDRKPVDFRWDWLPW